MTVTAEKYLTEANHHEDYLKRCRISPENHSGLLADVAADAGFCDLCHNHFHPDPQAMIKPLERSVKRLTTGRVGTDIDQNEYVEALESLMRQFKNEATNGKHFIP